MDTSPQPDRLIYSHAPIRILDNGGWTDTWFAKHGTIFNIGVSPYAEVQIQVYPRGALPGQVNLYVENFGDEYAVDLTAPDWQLHPLLEASIRRVGVPKDVDIRITLFSRAPSGASTGTSAAVSVALVGALYRLNSAWVSPHQVAYAAHAVETEMLGRQCGIQDQICSAYGGINMIEMPAYPQSHVTQLNLPFSTLWELERRISLIYLGKSHDSSEIHLKVIAELEDAGPDCCQLEDLRQTAVKSAQALTMGDFAALGRAMIENTAAQERLHPHLVGPEARKVIEIAKEFGAAGWKVNGAGGPGGSITLLSNPDDRLRRNMLRAVVEADPLFQVLPTRLAPAGLKVWEAEQCT